MSDLSSLRLETLIGPAIAPRIKEVAALRINHFRAFPYLYDGSLAYEEKYLEGYTREPRAMLIRVTDCDQLAAVATATPLASSADVVEEAPRLFAEAGLDPCAFYYYAEIIVEPAFRGRGIAKLVYAEREAWARRWGYTRLCLAVVKRPVAHPLKPDDYQSPERLFEREGFVRTGLEFPYEWPTIQPGGGVRSEKNPMVFWMKELAP